MNPFVLLIVKEIPIDFLVSELEKRISKWKTDPSDESLKRLIGACILLLANHTTKNLSPEEIEKRVQESDLATQIAKSIRG